MGAWESGIITKVCVWVSKHKHINRLLAPSRSGRITKVLPRNVGASCILTLFVIYSVSVIDEMEQMEGIAPKIHPNRGNFNWGHQITPLEKKKKEIIHDPYRSKVENPQTHTGSKDPHALDNNRDSLVKLYGKPFLTDEQWWQTKEYKLLARRSKR